MNTIVADTHALYWHLTHDVRLALAALQVFRQANQGLRRILVPGIVLIEMVYLVERNRIERAAVEQVFALFSQPVGSYAIAPLDEGTARALGRVPRTAVPDMPDRIIAGTALQHGLALISRDERIQRAGIVPVIW
jgi:PIN domain nuclease of toxin-antitoxin system